jgi:AcrR family transcriptional regulator
MAANRPSGHDGDPATPRRTRGGWKPVGTSAGRREAQATRGTARGEMTRKAILDAARRVFERDGYVTAGIRDIVSEAGVARGSFYTYFATKVDVFRVLSTQVRQAVDDAVGAGRSDDGGGVLATLYRSNARYIDVYRENAAMYGLIEQVSTLDERVHDQRLRGRKASVARVAESIIRWQRKGFADPDIASLPTASALVSLTSNTCYWWFVAGEEPPDDPARTITDIWIRALDLRDEPRLSSSPKHHNQETQ